VVSSLAAICARALSAARRVESVVGGVTCAAAGTANNRAAAKKLRVIPTNYLC
jgi:hypothetical protein